MSSSVVDMIESILNDQILSKRPIISVQKQIIQGFAALAFFLFILSAIFVLYGIYEKLSLSHTTEIVSMIMGGILGGSAIVISTGLYIFGVYKERYIKHLSRDIPQNIQDILLSIDDEFGGIVRSYPKTAVLMSFFMGYIIENKL